MPVGDAEAELGRRGAERVEVGAGAGCSFLFSSLFSLFYIFSLFSPFFSLLL